VAARSTARKRAVDILFEADLRQVGSMGVLEAHEERRRRESESPLNPYVRVLVEGVSAHQSRIDDLISTYAHGWTIERLPAVDRNILRVGLFELLWQSDLPGAVVISEAVELANLLSTDDSSAFVNGLLSTVDGVRNSLVL
jgi:N utilization substance protein B